MDARLPKCAPKPKPPPQKRAVLPAPTKTQQRPPRCAGGPEPIKRKDPLPVLKSAAVTKAPLQKEKTPVLPDSTKTQQRPPRRDGDLEPFKRKDTLVLKSAAVKKAHLQKGKTNILPPLTKTKQRPPRHAGDLEPIKRKDPLPPLVLKSAAVNKAPLQKGKTPVLPAVTTTQQGAPRHASYLQQRVQKQEKYRRCYGKQLTAAVASTAFRKYLTPFERREIKNYKEVWYLGIAAGKIQQKCPLSHGYDDSEGHYKMVIKDHIAYRYEVLELLGEGSFGRVLKCRDHKTKQLVAMKVIANDQRFADEAMAEVEILELLQKKDEDGVATIVHMKEHFHFRDHLCITFDLMGKNLYEMMNEREFRGLGTSQVRCYAISLVQSLQLLSRSGIIHCDLKPENILISQDNSEVIKVADFGASLLERRNTAPVAQTLIYMSPEVILTKAFSKAIDMWSLGCILAELKRGEVLFQVCDECELMLEMAKLLGVPPKDMLKDTPLENLLSGPRTSRRRTRRRLSKALDTEDELFLDFIQSCLEYEPAKRMTPDEARHHPWILMHFQSPSSSEDSSPHQSTNWEHMADSTSDTAPSASGPGPRPVGARGSRREGAQNKASPSLTGTCTVT